MLKDNSITVEKKSSFSENFNLLKMMILQIFNHNKKMHNTNIETKLKFF